MLSASNVREQKTPILAYFILIISIFILRQFLQWDLVFSISATLMFLIPLLLKRDSSFFYFNDTGFIKGVITSAIVLIAYVAVLYVFSVLTGGKLSVREFGFSFILLQFFLVAIPEEVFFRGYLQKEFGNDYKAVVIVSLMFAAAHLVAVCAVSGGINVCTQNALTFFPSLVMGYLYMKTGTIWSSVVFHFLANVLHILIYIA